MASWGTLNEVDEAWWELAYKLFLENNPMRTTMSNVAYYLSGDKWNDYGFSCETHVPPTGQFRGVSKKAILVVISRKRCMDYTDWKKLHGTRSDAEPEDLNQYDKDVIYRITDQIYNEDGSPKPFNRG